MLSMNTSSMGVIACFTTCQQLSQYHNEGMGQMKMEQLCKAQGHENNERTFSCKSSAPPIIVTVSIFKSPPSSPTFECMAMSSLSSARRYMMPWCGPRTNSSRRATGHATMAYRRHVLLS